MTIAIVCGPYWRTSNLYPQNSNRCWTKTTVTIAPNDKYREVMHGELAGNEPVPEAEAEHADDAEVFRELIAEAPTTDEFDMSYDDMKSLSWDLLIVSCDSDLVTKMATYFDGVDADEQTDLIRAELRLLDADIYPDAQLAAREGLR